MEPALSGVVEELQFWQNGANRLYAVQDPEAPEAHLRGRFHTGADGSYAFLAVRPVPLSRKCASSSRKCPAS